MARNSQSQKLAKRNSGVPIGTRSWRWKRTGSPLSISRADARKRGLTKYYTGFPCIFGHFAERTVCSGNCQECARLRHYGMDALPERLTLTDRLFLDRKRKGDRLLSRKDAIKRGLVKYFNGLSCLKGHVSERYVASKRCVECDRTLGSVKNTYRTNGKERKAGRKKPKQCEVCGGRGLIVFDHCHATGVFRGWICDPCNRTLGQSQDNAERLRKLADYLEKGIKNAGS